MLYIRADGSAKTGAGHLMRCLTVADAVSDRGQVCFLCGDGASASFAQKRGYRARVLTGEPFSAREAGEICGLIREEERTHVGKPVILADSYLITQGYIEKLCACGDAETALMDDMADQPFYGPRWIINYNFFADQSRYRQIYGGGQETPDFLLGADYIPLRPQFWQRRREKCQEREKRLETGELQETTKSLERILITAGGGDHQNIAGAVLECLMGERRLRDTKIHVVCGAFNPNLEKVQHLAGLRDMIYVHQSVEDMAGLMARCDAAVTAGGTTIYELCAVGVPFVGFSYADNQEALVRYVGEHGIGIDAGDYRADNRQTVGRIRDGVLRLLDRKSQAETYRRKAMERVDGRGAERIAGVICGMR